MTREIFDSIALMLILAMTIKNLFYFWDIWRICKNEQKRLLYERTAYKKLAETLTKDD